MTKYKFRVSLLEYGVIEVEADNIEDARDKAYDMDGSFYCNNSEVTDIQPFNH